LKQGVKTSGVFLPYFFACPSLLPLLESGVVALTCSPHLKCLTVCKTLYH